MKKIFSTVLFLGCSFLALAQIPPNCPPTALNNTVDIINPSIATCGNPVTLSANLTTSAASTTNYSVTPTVYNPYPWVGANQLTSIINVDDTWSSIVTLPFTFCYFGNSFTQFVVSSNGSVSFDVANANGGSAWATSTWGPMPVPTATSGGEFDNSILGPHHDVLPSASSAAGANITWQVYGTAPCRAMVISWDSIALFSCTSSNVSQQIVLYESSNIIDIYVKEKTLCSAWNGGIAYEGIQNANGTLAVAVPGRNGQQFTCVNDGQRFTPTGAPAVTYNWYNAATNVLIGSGSNITVAPNNTTTYYVEATVTVCGAPNLVISDTETVVVSFPVIANFTEDVNLGCEDDTIVFTNTSTNGQTFLWSFGNGNTSASVDPTHIYVNQGIYVVTLIAGYNNLCFDTISKTFNLFHPINASYVTNYSPAPINDSLCLGNAITINNFSIGGGLISNFDMGNGVVIIKNNSVPFQYTYTTPGIYNTLLTITDTLGCTDTFSRQIFVDNPPYAQLTVTDSNICIGEPVFFNDSVAPFTKAFTYDFGDGIVLQNEHDPTHTFQTGGSPQVFNVTFTADYLVCPDLVITKPISVYNYPTVNLGPDTSICPGSTGLINLSVNSGNNYLWSNGITSNNIQVAEANYYWVRVGNGDCYTSDSIWVKRDCYLNVPNSFTPNSNDELNKYFMPMADMASGVKTYSLNIYNRWGELVFTTNNVNSRGWDGNFGGKPQPMGSYVYQIKVVFNNSSLPTTYTGNVTLLR